MKLDIPQGATFEPSYVYDVLKLEKYASTFIVSYMIQTFMKAKWANLFLFI